MTLEIDATVRFRAHEATRVRNRVGDQLIGEPASERRNPARSGDVVALAPAADRTTLDLAVDIAQQAQRKWAATPAPERGAVLLRAAGIVAERSERIVVDLVREEGKTLGEASGEVSRAVEILYFYGGEGRRGRAETMPSSTRNTFVYTRREPLGVVGVITPWNFPIAIPTWKTAPALIAGNAVILKPAGLTPLSVWHLAEALADAGLPPGVLNVLYGSGAVVGSAIAEDPRIAAVSFTGSNSVGRDIEARVNARHGRVLLEMGGKNPLIVLDDADPERAADIASAGAFGLTGQACTATSRVICTPGIRDAFVAAFTARLSRFTPGDGLDPATTMGPVVSDDQLQTDLDWIDIATADGATSVAPVRREDRMLHPVLLTGVRASDRVAQEEVFGPVVALLDADDLDDALDIANGVAYGLSAGVVTNDMRNAQRFIAGIEAGIVKVNRPTSGVDNNVPFGGVKESSTNTYREQGSAALDFYTWTKAVYVGVDES